MTLTVLCLSLIGSICQEFFRYTRETIYPYAPDNFPSFWTTMIMGTAPAPAQYRVGVIRVAYWMTQHLHMGMRFTLCIVDMTSVLTAVLLLYSLLVQSSIYRNAGLAAQWFSSAAFVLLVQFYLVWPFMDMRPETLPSTLIVAMLLWLWTRKNSWLNQSTEGHMLTATIILLLSLAQGLVRADVAIAMNAGVFLVCLTRSGKDLGLPKTAALLTSLASILLAGAIQVYMMKVVYPHARYIEAVFQLKLNINSLSRIVTLLLFLPPYVWTLDQIRRRRFTVNASDLALIVGSLIYAGMWSILGTWRAVRIFLPFAMALVPLTVQMAMRRIEQTSPVEAWLSRIPDTVTLAPEGIEVSKT